MEWLLGAYLVVGVIKTLGRINTPNPAMKPTWMISVKNPLIFAVLFALHAVLWPFAKR